MDPPMQAIACRPCTTSPRRTRSGSPPKALACPAGYRQPARDSPMIEHIDDVFVGRDGRAVRFADVGQSGTPSSYGAMAGPEAGSSRADKPPKPTKPGCDRPGSTGPGTGARLPVPAAPSGARSWTLLPQLAISARAGIAAIGIPGHEG